MQDLSAKAREPFFHPEHLYLNKGQERTGHSLGDSITRHLGLDDLFPKEETTWDSFGFEPCGYSSNAIVGNGAEGAQGYVSVHVTPGEW
jgi:S-adenosylmethionine decarboxylase